MAAQIKHFNKTTWETGHWENGHWKNGHATPSPNLLIIFVCDSL
jgi:hypothetical protein